MKTTAIEFLKDKIEKRKEIKVLEEIKRDILLEFKKEENSNHILLKAPDKLYSTENYLTIYFLMALNENKELLTKRTMELEKQYFEKALKEAQEESLEILKGNI